MDNRNWIMEKGKIGREKGNGTWIIENVCWKMDKKK